MGCIICNIFEGIPPVIDDAHDEQRIDELKEEICNDIAICHPEMVDRIIEIRAARRQTMKYSQDETALVVKLREDGWIGQRLYDRFHKVFPGRSYQSVRSKIEALREKKVIREKRRVIPR